MTGRPRAWAVLVGTWLALVAASAAAQPAAAARGFAVAPYVVDATQNEATVAFHLAGPGRATVLVFDGPESREIPAGKPRRGHFVRVDGLAPGRTYRYEVRCEQGACATPAGEESYQIRTAGQPGESFTFTVYGDPRPGETATHRHHRLLIDQMLQVEPAFSLVLGDMVDDGSRAGSWERFFEIEAPLRRRAAIFPVLGDNDVAQGRGLAARYFPRAAAGPYHFVWGGVHFFGVEAWGTRGAQPESDFDGDSEQVRWITAKLGSEAVRNAPFRILFLHDPIYVSRGRASATLQRVWGPLLSEGNVDLVFASWHLYERSRHESVTYVISGGAGAELVWFEPDPDYPAQVDARRHHYCRVDVKPGALHLRAVAEDGTVLDSITLLPRTDRDEPGGGGTARLARRLGRELAIGVGPKRPELRIELFSYDCAYCRRLLSRELPSLASDYDVGLRVRYYDLAQPGAYDLLMAAGADFGRQDADVPTVFVGRSVLGGEEEIRAGLPRQLERFRAAPQAYREQAIVPFGAAHDTQAMRAERFEALSLGVVLAAGLLDGINPCAFTTIVFLLSYLSLAGGSRRQLLLTGGIFTLAVFVTYLAIGVLFYQLASVLMGHRTVAAAINGLLLVGLGVLAVLSGRDAVRAVRGHPTDLALKLPAGLQRRIRARIRAFARRGSVVGAASFSLGVIVAGMELACTGQVYVPIVTMIAEPRYRAEAALHLVAYNVAFIVPLAAVFALSAFGMTSARLARWARRHVATVKIGLTLLFVALAAVVLYNLGLLS